MSRNRTSGLSILAGETQKNLSSHLQEDVQAQMVTIARAVSLTHQGFSPIVLARDFAVREASGQKIKEGQDFSPKVSEGGQGFAQLCRTITLDTSNPGI